MWLSFSCIVQFLYSVAAVHMHIAFDCAHKNRVDFTDKMDVIYIVILLNCGECRVLCVNRGKNVEALQKVLQCSPLASKNQAVKVSFSLIYCYYTYSKHQFSVGHSSS